MSRMLYDCAECRVLHSVVYVRPITGGYGLVPHVVSAKLDPARLKREEDFISKLPSRVGEGGRP